MTEGLTIFRALVIMTTGWAQLSRDVRSQTFAEEGKLRARRPRRGGLQQADHRPPHPPNPMSQVSVAITRGIPPIALIVSSLGLLRVVVYPPMISQGLMLQDAGAVASIGPRPSVLTLVCLALHRPCLQHAGRRPARCRRTLLRPRHERPIPASGASDKRRPLRRSCTAEHGVVEAASDMSFTAGPGRTTASAGESGSGKTTFGRAIVEVGQVDEALVDPNADDTRRLVRAALEIAT